jgi:hypothetical protein
LPVDLALLLPVSAEDVGVEELLPDAEGDDDGEGDDRARGFLMSSSSRPMQEDVPPIIMETMKRS